MLLFTASFLLKELFRYCFGYGFLTSFGCGAGFSMGFSILVLCKMNKYGFEIGI
jgi:hypothetical protein